MGRVQPACMVPGCAGKLELGKRDGKTAEWCPVCERRLHQLKALHKRLAEATSQTQGSGSLRASDAKEPHAFDDRAILALVGERLVMFKDAVRISRRGANSVRDAIASGAVLSWPVGKRGMLIARDSLMAWSSSIPSRYITSVIGQAIPRYEDEAVTALELATLAGVEKSSVYNWLTRARQDKALQRVARFNRQGRPVVAYWWKEANHG